MMPLDAIALWLATYALHSTLLLGSAWLLARLMPAARERLWRFAVLGAVVTATLSAAGWLTPRSSLGLPGLVAAGERRIPHATHADRVAATDSGLAAHPEAGQRHDALATHARGLGLAVAPAAGRRSRLAASAYGPGAGRAPETDLGTTGNGVAAADGPLGLGAWRWIAALWLLLTAATVTVLSVRTVRFRRRLLAGRREVAGEARRLLDDLGRRAGFGHAVRLALCPAARVPMARGVRRPEICLPAALEHQLDGEELEAALAHELAHLERHDPLWRALIRAVASVLSFQPLNRLACRELEREAEIRCDDRAAALTGRPAALARCLTRVARWTTGEQPTALPALGSDGSWLRRRVVRLLEARPHPRASRWLQAVAVAPPLVVALFAPGLGAAPATGLSVPPAGDPVLTTAEREPRDEPAVAAAPRPVVAAGVLPDDAPPLVHRLAVPVFATEPVAATMPQTRTAPLLATRPPAAPTAPAAAAPESPAAPAVAPRAQTALPEPEAEGARAQRARAAAIGVRVAEARATERAGRTEAEIAPAETEPQAAEETATTAAEAAAEAAERPRDERYEQLEEELERTLDELDARLESTVGAVEESIEAQLDALEESIESQLEGLEDEVEGSLEPLEDALEGLAEEHEQALAAGDDERAEMLARRMGELGSAMGELGTRLGTTMSELAGILTGSAIGDLARLDHQGVAELARAQAETARRLAQELQTRRETGGPLDEREVQALRERMDALARELEPKRRELEETMREIEIDLGPTRERLLRLREEIQRELEQWRERHRDLLEGAGSDVV